MAGLGTILVWLGFALGVGAIAWLVVLASSGGLPHRPLPTTSVVTALVGGVLVLGSLAAPWIQGRSADTGDALVLSGWSGLDPLTVVVLVAVVALVAVVVLTGRRRQRTGASDDGTGGGRDGDDGTGDERDGGAAVLLGVLAAAAAGLVAGNLLIQADQPGGSRVAPLGFALGLVGVASIGASALLARRPTR